jgi:hypothetical protein
MKIFEPLQHSSCGTRGLSPLLYDEVFMRVLDIHAIALQTCLSLCKNHHHFCIFVPCVMKQQELTGGAT